MKFIFSYIFFLLILSFSGRSQENTPNLSGSFLLQNYSPKEYNGNPQIFDIVQDSRGLMYFSNQKGVFEFDGINWNNIPIGKDDLRVLSLATGKDGLIYVGANGDYGVLKPDSIGKLEFVSLLSDLKIDSIGRVSQLVIHDEYQYLKTPKQLYVLGPEGTQVIRSKTEITWISIINDKLFVLQKDLGLFANEPLGLRLVREGYVFANKSIKSYIKFDNKDIIVTGEHGLFEMNPKGGFEKINAFSDLPLISGITLSKDLISLGSISSGIIILDKNYNTVNNIGLEKGIVDAAIKTQFVDKERNLWLGTNVGISKIEISSPILKFDKTDGLRSGIESITEANGRLFIAALDGFYKMNDQGFFEITGDINSDCYNAQRVVIEKDTLIFIAGISEAWALDKKGVRTSVQQGGPWDIKQSPVNPNEVVILHYDGIANLLYEDGEFVSKNYIRNFTTAEPFNFIIQKDGTIWIGTVQDLDGGVYKTHVDVFRDSTIKFERFYVDEGLPVGAAYLFEHDNEIYVGTDKGLYKHDNGQFSVYNGFGVDFTDERGVHRINEDEEGNVWMVLFDKDNNYEIGFSKMIDGKYVWNSKMFTRHSEEIVHALYHQEKGVSWLGGPNGLLRFDSKIENGYNTPFNALIRDVKFGEKSEFAGTYIENDKLSLIQNKEYSFNYSANTPIEFYYSSTSFIDEKNTLYSFILEGHSNNWSKWSSRSMKEYYLSEGDYTFKVKAKNVYGVITEEVLFHFSVLPPWYRTTWAYVLYVVGFLFVVYVSIRLSIRRVKQKNIQLEGIIEERTKEVVIQKQDAEKQRDIAEYQKELVEEAHREITDSINYAERIQRSFLATDDILSEFLDDYFVFFQPKDVVSGDFYWAGKLSNGKFAMVNADSTGHGVPGAIMSILNISSIEKAIEQKLTDPPAIFNATRKTIVERLKKDGSEEGGKDGMDASIICFDFDNNRFTYTAAQNPIWVVRNGNLTEIKPEKMPVGKHDKDHVPFVGGEYEMKKGDIIYTLTDGFQDQFGGPKEKKFMVKKMREYVLSISHLSMKEQHKRISETFAEWKGDIEQVDDVCVIGVRI